MQSSLAAQLKRITHDSTNTLNTKKLKSIHATSLLFPPAVAATQDLDTIYSIALEGFRELCLLDERFIVFERGLFSESSKDVDRFTQTKDEVKELDASLEAFLQLVSGRLLLKPAIKAVEWLVRRFRCLLFFSILKGLGNVLTTTPEFRIKTRRHSYWLSYPTMLIHHFCPL
jgi:U3 small nucleolar RNA-associated protein 10